MKQLVSTEILIVFLILLLISNIYYIFFERIGMLFVLLVGVVIIYTSMYFKNQLRGLVMFWIGIALLLFVLLSNPYTLTLIFSFIIILVVRYLVMKRKPVHVIATDTNIHVHKQSWFNTKETPNEVYKFEDLHLQHAIGDIYIDLTQAANLKGENTIVIQSMVGKTTVVVPYHIQTKVSYSALYGELKVDEGYKHRSRNERLTYESEVYENGIVIKIYASSIVGDLEVIHR